MPLLSAAWSSPYDAGAGLAEADDVDVDDVDDVEVVLADDPGAVG